ncbi:MAG: hypothetical protein H7Z42_21635, partial [Roseiflexaceae bacterium]|nr:hypothetical protein [Roseiflexaceae bacterium]
MLTQPVPVEAPAPGRAEIALALFDGAVRAHALAPEHRPLLLLAAQYFEHVRQQGLERPARAARDLVLAQPIDGLNAEAQSLVASAVAFQSERIKRDQELAFLRLNERDKHSALQLAAILSLSEALAANSARVQVAPLLRDGTGETVVTVAGERAAHAIEAASDRDWRWLEALGPITIRPAAPEERLPILPSIEHAHTIGEAPPGVIGEQDFAENARRSLRRHFEKMLARESEVRS